MGVCERGWEGVCEGVCVREDGRVCVRMGRCGYGYGCGWVCVRMGEVWVRVWVCERMGRCG